MPRYPGTLLRSQALSPTRSITKGCQSSTRTQNTINNERLEIPLRQDARRAAVAAGAAPTVICFLGQPRRGDGRGLEPARLDARSLGRGTGMGALRPGERAARVAGPGISRVAGRRIVAKTHLGARRVGRGERVGGGHGPASVTMSAARFVDIDLFHGAAPSRLVLAFPSLCPR